MPRPEEFDYVIAGAGSAGCVLAARLTEDPAVRVLLLEAGGWDRDPLIRIPLGVGRIWQKRLHDWGYDVEPEPGLGGRRIPCLRGKVIGGSSSINAMAYVRGHRSDYDRWAASGLKGWSYADVLPYFRRQESWQGGATAYRGADGPLATRFSTYEDPMAEAWLEAGRAAGYPVIEDYNGERQEGFARGQFSIRNGRRESTASAYLRPALGRPGLQVKVNALATRVLFGSDNGRGATGIEYVQDGKRLSALAEREVILAGGAINSPHLLMLSGIGDPEELGKHGIEVRAALRGVGANLRDHLGPPVTSRRNARGPLQRRLRMDRAMLMLGQAWLFGRGFATALPGGPMVFLKSDSSLPAPDIQLLINAAPMFAAPYRPFETGYPDEFTARPILLRPESRGRVRLACADPAHKALIQQNFLSAARDWETLRAGIRVTREVLRRQPLAQYVERELFPGKDRISDADLDERIRATSTTANHPAGTCRMGLAGDPLAVVDDELRVFGVARLRVVDASVMPDLVGGNINAPVIMIGERAADLLRGRPALAPAKLAN